MTMHRDIEAAMESGCTSDKGCAPLTVVGEPSHTRSAIVTELAMSAMTAAVQSMQAFAAHHFDGDFSATVYNDLVDDWCDSSAIPVGWELPNKWDDLSADYPTKNGWVRTHANYAHHNAIVRKILGNAKNHAEAAAFVAKHTSEEIQEAIVAGGAAAAAWNPRDVWRKSEQGKAVDAQRIVEWSERPAIGKTWKPTDAKRPLKGLKVLDLTRVLAGPVSTRFLATFGASVLRIDPATWEEGLNEIEMTAGKRCSTLDLKSVDGQATLKALAEEADILVSGYRADALEKLGLGEEQLRDINPNLIYVTLNAFGWQGPWRNRRGFDSLVQRATGLAAPGPGGKPQALPYQVLDHATGYLMAAAAVRALLRASRDDVILSARLSLVRQAHLILDHMDQPRTPMMPMTDAQKNRPTTREDTPWGPIDRLPLPFEIAGIDAGWSSPARGVRKDPPEFREEAAA